MTFRHIIAIDIGASSGRMMLARYKTGDKKLDLQEVHRFVNQLQHIGNNYCWDLINIEKEILYGLNKVIAQGITIDSIGIDTWGVDYVLLNQHGEVVAPTYSYRDHRTDSVMTQVHQELGCDVIYQKTGIQFLTFNTLYQLKAMMNESPDYFDQVTDLVMIPDYLSYRLTGVLNREYTNATTTQLVNVKTNDWDDDLLNYLGVPRRWFGEIRQPCNQVGYWTAENGSKIPVIAVASHDTASAVIAAPLRGKNSTYLCSGTWSLMGLDSELSCTDKKALLFNITNEGGVEGRYRILKNIMGMWLFQRICAEHNVQNIVELVQQATAEPAFQSLINPNDARFLNPESMTEAIKQFCYDAEQPIPQTLPQLTRCIFDSLAMLYQEVLNELSILNGQPIETLHIVGGGCQNEFLNQLCANLCDMEVTAGPIEASTLGNVGCQLIAQGDFDSVAQLRAMFIHNFPLKQYQPNLAVQHQYKNQSITEKWQQCCSLVH